MNTTEHSGQPFAARLNGLFLALGVLGFAIIFSDSFSDSLSDTAGNPVMVYLGPTGVVLLYAAVVAAATRRWEDRVLAEHHIDSIYFMGFLFTLFSLITLFYRMNNGEADQVSQVLTYVGISVSTSITGVLFRSIVRGSYLTRHPERSVDSIEAFLAERAETTAALERTESRYLDALEQYINATDTFSRSLGEAQERLLPQVETLAEILGSQNRNLQEFNTLEQRLSATVGMVEKHAAAAPWQLITDRLEQFQTGVSELDGVLESLITILEDKVERIR